jgi:hypothetical protein
MGRLIRSWELLEARGVRLIRVGGRMLRMSEETWRRPGRGNRRIREKFPLLEETAINGQAARPRWAHADGCGQEPRGGAAPHVRHRCYGLSALLRPVEAVSGSHESRGRARDPRESGSAHRSARATPGARLPRQERRDRGAPGRAHPMQHKKLQRFRAGVEGIISFTKRCFGFGRCVVRLPVLSCIRMGFGAIHQPLIVGSAVRDLIARTDRRAHQRCPIFGRLPPSVVRRAEALEKRHVTAHSDSS